MGVCALGDGCWTILTGGGFREISQRRCRTILTAGSVDQRANYVAGYYSHRNQFWAAVAAPDSNYIRRILAFDPGEGRNGAVLVFEPANIGTTESITAMCELPYGDDSPSMLVGTDSGKILRYPSTTITDGATGFASHWRAYESSLWVLEERLETRRATLKRGEAVELQRALVKVLERR